MASIATTRLRLDKQATGDNPNAWGIRLNAALDLIDESQGVSVVVVNADVTLTSNNYTSDQSRRAVLRFTGAGGFTVTVPPVEKLYLIDNRCAADVTLKTAGGTSAVVRGGSKVPIYVDAIDTTAVDPALNQIKVPTDAVSFAAQRAINIAPGINPNDACTYAQMQTIAGAAAAPANFVALAQAWATQISGEVVTGQGYSARYWAMQSGASAAAAATFNPALYANKNFAFALAVTV